MAEKNVLFEEIKDRINKIVRGNRYIISEFEKFKGSIENLQKNIQDVSDPDKSLAEIKDKLDSLSDLFKLGKTVKNLKPTINELNETMKSMSEIKKTVDDIKKSVTTLGDLKLLASELKMTMAEIRETSKIMKMDVTTAEIELAKIKPTIKPPTIKPIEKIRPISSSKSIEQKTVSSDPLTKGPLKASPMYKIKKPESVTETKAESIKTEPIIIKPTTVKSIKSEPTIIKPITMKSIKSEPTIIKPITMKLIKSEPTIIKPIIKNSNKVDKIIKAPSKKKGITHPIVLEIFQLIKQRAQSGESAEALSKHIENARDTIAKSWKWHPALLELGTFARKLKKLPPKNPPSPDLIKILLEKLEEWKAKMT